MKVSELFEAPYKHEGEMERHNFDGSYTSDSSLARLYDKIGEIQTRGREFEIYLKKTKSVLIVTYKEEKKDTKVISNRLVLDIDFKSTKTLVNIPKEFKERDLLQVDKTSIDERFEGWGIASFSYISLAKAGYIIVSDTSQFEPGAQLWKKLAREAHVKNYEIYVLDDEYGFMKDENGKIIKYDASNIDDAKIWSHDQDFSGSHILLTLKHH